MSHRRLPLDEPLTGAPEHLIVAAEHDTDLAGVALQGVLGELLHLSPAPRLGELLASPRDLDPAVGGVDDTVDVLDLPLGGGVLLLLGDDLGVPREESLLAGHHEDLVPPDAGVAHELVLGQEGLEDLLDGGELVLPGQVIHPDGSGLDRDGLALDRDDGPDVDVLLHVVLLGDVGGLPLGDVEGHVEVLLGDARQVLLDGPVVGLAVARIAVSHLRSLGHEDQELPESVGVHLGSLSVCPCLRSCQVTEYLSAIAHGSGAT